MRKNRRINLENPSGWIEKRGDDGIVAPLMKCMK
jgi:hypothetical protein